MSKRLRQSHHRLFILCIFVIRYICEAAIQETVQQERVSSAIASMFFYVKPPSSSSNARLILNNTPVFQLSSLVTWSYEYTVPVNLSKSASSHASMRSLANLASRVEGNVRSFWANSVSSLWVVTRSYKNVNTGSNTRFDSRPWPLNKEQRAASTP